MYVGNFSHRGFAVAHGHHVDALVFQRQAHHLLDVAIIVRHQDLGHRTSSGRNLYPRRFTQYLAAIFHSLAAPQRCSLPEIFRKYSRAPLYLSIRPNTRQCEQGSSVSETNTGPMAQITSAAIRYQGVTIMKTGPASARRTPFLIVSYSVLFDFFRGPESGRSSILTRE